MFINSHKSRRNNPTRTPTSEVFNSVVHPHNNTNHNTTMPRKYQTTTTTTTSRRHGLFRRKVHHQKRKTTLSDKIAGGLKKLKGAITRNPAEKVRIINTHGYNIYNW